MRLLRRRPVLVFALALIAALSSSSVAQAGVYRGPNGSRSVIGAIEAKYLSLGGSSGFLAGPLTDELATPGRFGRFNHFEGGSVYWSPATGAHEVHGAIRDTWAALGWERGLGFPVTDESATPDGIGRFNHFENGSVYWTGATGAHEVRGMIRQSWAAGGWETGVLGYPTTDERGTPDGVGRFNHFEHGSVYWTPRTGARTLVGPIRDAWAQLGWERSVLGYPVSDVLPLYDGGIQPGPNRYASFQNGRMYWSVDTGAHEVHGAILARWLQMGAEVSGLGYPVSDEYAVPGGRRSDFEGGSLIWTPSGGVVLEAVFTSDTSPGGFRFDKGTGPLVLDVDLRGANFNSYLGRSSSSGQPTAMVSRLGDWSGTVPLDFGVADPNLQSRIFTVSALDSWTVRFRDPSTIPPIVGGQTIGGAGADVLRLAGPAGTVAFSGSGCGDDARVRWYDARTTPGAGLQGDGVQPDLVGSLATGAGGYLEVRCDGPWTLTVP